MKEDRLPHYYGDTIRVFFVIGGITMLLTLPFFKYLIDVPVFISILAMLAIGVVAGLTSPRRRWVIILDTVFSAAAFLVFEYYAISKYVQINDMLFLTNQFLALIFFIALYYSVKTWRGFTWFLD